MLKLYVLEGARGVGKSEVSRLLRSSVWGSTLINLTGFEQDGEEGLSKIQDYYYGVLAYLKTLAKSQHAYTVIFDRLFFSEMVYAPLHKSYDFSIIYTVLCEELLKMCNEIHLTFMTLDEPEELFTRLNRDKVRLFDSVRESVENSLQQQEQYRTLFTQLQDKYGKYEQLHFTELNTSRLTPQQVKNMILKE